MGNGVRYEFGKAVNRYDQPVNVMMELGYAGQFSYFDKGKNALNVLNVTKADLGYWRLLVIAQELQNGISYSYSRYFYLRVI